MDGTDEDFRRVFVQRGPPEAGEKLLTGRITASLGHGHFLIHRGWSAMGFKPPSGYFRWRRGLGC
jgi:hypothetical protein